MHRTRVKFCGMMRAQDARLAIEAGADAIGMIFHAPSRRNIAIARAREIVAAIGPFAAAVGVFVDAGNEKIIPMFWEVGLSAVQLHGRERPEQVRELVASGLRVIKSIRVDERIEAELSLWRNNPAIAAIVLETATSAPGGSGVANDWDAIARYQASGLFAGLPPIIAAGGLSPENVGDVVRAIRPWAVDVSSGVENRFGEKSAEKIAVFVAAVRAADATIG